MADVVGQTSHFPIVSFECQITICTKPIAVSGCIAEKLYTKQTNIDNLVYQKAPFQRHQTAQIEKNNYLMLKLKYPDYL